MNLLMHVCCAPCANRPLEVLREEGHALTGFWYNPNIHPYTEYRSRKEALEGYAASVGLPLVVQGDYGLREFLRAVADDPDARCGHCYRYRMEHAARHAAQEGFDAFTTSLLISPYQNHEAIREAAGQAAEKFGTQFFYRDFRPLFREGQANARQLGLYMQKYCGCVFSEEERYRKKP